jgi:hypothetical protein
VLDFVLSGTKLACIEASQPAKRSPSPRRVRSTCMRRRKCSPFSISSSARKRPPSARVSRGTGRDRRTADRNRAAAGGLALHELMNSLVRKAEQRSRVAQADGRSALGQRGCRSASRCLQCALDAHGGLLASAVRRQRLPHSRGQLESFDEVRFPRDPFRVGPENVHARSKSFSNVPSSRVQRSAPGPASSNAGDRHVPAAFVRLERDRKSSSHPRSHPFP